MALINRVARLFQADFHAVLDRIEEPEQLLRQAVRDMEAELNAAELRIADCEREQQVLTGRMKEITASATESDTQLDLCFRSGKDDLARGLIRRRLEGERILRRLASRHETNDAFLSEQRKQLDENRRALDALRQKAEVFAHRPLVKAEFDDGTWIARELHVGDDEVEIAFLHEQAQRSSS
ncbi:MAG: PspA/IM30 family protein [Gammaproteobacteria bacterium]|nr:PspA/IM30 family protein [Gammaproteobacteria bacterium]